MRLGGREALVASLVAVVLVAAGHSFVLQKWVDGPTRYLQLDEWGDAAEYRRMVEGDLASARSPFRYRVLVPLLAKAMPLPAFDALRVISYVSLLAIYFLLFLTGKSAGLSPPATLAGILVLFLSPAHLYHYYNPFPARRALPIDRDSSARATPVQGL